MHGRQRVGRAHSRAPKQRNDPGDRGIEQITCRDCRILSIVEELFGIRQNILQITANLIGLALDGLEVETMKSWAFRYRPSVGFTVVTSSMNNRAREGPPPRLNEALGQSDQSDSWKRESKLRSA